jgi:hypothetical protein
LKLLRTIRLDASDTFVFDRAAEPGEWAVPGSFVFWNEDLSQLETKARVAFRSGFLGVETLGWSTLVQIVEASDEQRAAAIGTLTRQLMDRFGAPSLAEATAAATGEFEFATSLCTHPVDTVIAMHRTEENGEIRETFRSLRPREDGKSFRAFSFLDVEDAPEEHVDLTALGREAKP